MSELRLNTDGHIIKFGADNDVSLTHVADTGLLLNSTRQLQFNDASQNINAPSATVLDINATDEIELNATLVDINANVEISGTATTTGVHTFSAAPVFPDGSIAVADLDIDGATDIGAAVVDADLFIIDDGAGGTNRKVTASRLKTYAGGAAVMNDLTDVSMDISNYVDGLLIQPNSDGSAPGTGTLNNATGNVGIGKDTFAALTTGDYNVFLGYNSGAALTTGSNNVAIGKGAGAAITEGATIVAIGLDALAAEDTDSDAIAIGANALKANDQGNHNIAIGKDALKANVAGSKNVAIGWQAGMTQANADSDDSIFIGYKAGTLANAANTGSVMIGSSAGVATTTGLYNTFIGLEAGGANTTGSRNLAIGYGPLDGPDTENDNIAIGYSALGGSVAGGEFNIAIGNYAGDAITSGDNNVAIGHNSLTAAIAGENNTSIGSGAGLAMTGSEGVFIGKSAGASASSGGAAICIGSSADVAAATQDYGIAIGYSLSAAASDFSFGRASNVVTNDYDADADWSRSSDIRLKRNIESTTLGLDFINDLRPVRFQWKPSYEVPREMTTEYHKENQKDLDYISHGFIAQEVKEAIDKHGDKTFGGWHMDKVDNETQRVKKNMFVMPLIKAVQELTERVKELEAK